jgi:abhydrolase domain-containing protein 12
MEVAEIAPHRIVILGHSLGTAVAAAVVEHFALQGTEFAGLVLLSGFSGMRNLLSDFCLVGLLSPLRIYPRLLQFFTARVRDTWQSADRIANFVRVSRRVRLYIVHSLNDPEIRPHHADELFNAAADAAIDANADGGLDQSQVEEIKQKNTIDMGDGAFIRSVRIDTDGTEKLIRQDVVPYGCECFILWFSSVHY